MKKLISCHCLLHFIYIYNYDIYILMSLSFITVVLLLLYIWYISIDNLSKGKTQRSDTYVWLLCGSGISFCCQSHLVPVLFRF